MSRFSDNWLLDKVMFDYVQGGSCACCGFPHLFAPGGLEGLIHAMSDLETDSKTHEINAAKLSPWPTDMRDQIWGDRLLLRFKMKKEMKDYRGFLEEVVVTGHNNNNATNNVDTKNNNDDESNINIQDAIPILHEFCTTQLTPYDLHQIFQLQRSDLTEILKSKYKITSAFAIVFCSVVEQLANFDLTGYGVDAPPCCDGSVDDNAEELFETVLKYNSRGPGFHLDVATNIIEEDSEEEWKVNDEVLNIFLKRMLSLAGPALLARAPKSVADNDDEEEEEGGGKNNSSGDETEKDNEQSDTSNSKPSFRSDRRVARLMIARCWTDRLIEKYRSMQEIIDK